MSEGKKYDQDKIRFDLIPVEAIEALAKVLKMGSEKYGDNNWREGIKYHRVYRAAQHHLQEFWGEHLDKDTESGLPHLYHALCNIAFLITYEDNKERYRTFDDRAGSCNSYFKNQQDNVDILLNMVNDNQGFFNHGPDKTCLEAVIEVLKNAIQDKKFPDLTKMTQAEAYKHLEVGMRVRVLRKAECGERGWQVGWVDSMGKYIGGEFLIERLTDAGGAALMYEEGSCTWNFPAFVLEIISRPNPKGEPAFPNLTKMTHLEACKHLEVGMRVKIIKRAEDKERGWTTCWASEMDSFIGKIQTIQTIHMIDIEPHGITFVEDNEKWYFPAFVLEIVNREEIE